MPRTARIAPAGLIFHVLNRANAGAQLFERDADYRGFEDLLVETGVRLPVPILAYCLMPTHWHLVLWPQRDGDLGAFMQRLTTTHARRWHLARRSVGRGHLYQGPYKSFPVADDAHLLTVCRYVERNPLRARLVARAEDWRWSSLSDRGGAPERPALSPGPMARPTDWLAWVNEPQTAAELEAVRTCVRRGRPYGGEAWSRAAAERLGLQSALRSRGRPRKEEDMA